MYKVLKKKIVSVLVLNQANVLTRVVSLFGRRGFNIDSLTVSATNDPTLSRITIVFSATERSMQQIITQTAKLEVVKSIFLLDRENSLYRELLLLKVNATSEQRRPCLLYTSLPVASIAAPPASTLVVLKSQPNFSAMRVST